MNWEQWIQRIYQLLGLPVGSSVSALSLPQPFLLAPQEDEISPEEAKALFAVVRERMIGGLVSPITAGPIRERIRVLSPVESLPLLYAMRLVARNWGRPHRYWPEFHERVLGSQVELGTVQVGLAAELRNLWLRFYQTTGRVLYYPREGRVNIKWPIVHAGLLSEDIEALRHYGVTLISEPDASAGELPSLLTGEIDDFLLDLLDWLDTSSYAYSRLRQMLDPNEAVSFSVADLARSWLRRHIFELQSPPMGGETVIRRRPQVRLRYDPSRGELEAVLGEMVWPNRIANVVVEFGEIEEKLGTIYVPTENKSRTMPCSLALKTPVWPTAVTIRVDGERTAISVLPSPFSQGGRRGALLFRADTGYRTRQWAIGEQYYLVTASEMGQKDWMRAIFSNLVSLGPPVGAWVGYETFLVTARDPLEDISPEDQDARLEEINDQLAQASVGLSLPGLSDLYRPRARAVGGSRIPTAGSVDSFTKASLPYFEISGRWGRSLQAQLSLWQNGEYAHLEQTVLEPNQNGLPVLLAPSWTRISPEEGAYYRLLLGEETAYGFRCVPEEGPGPHVLRVDLQFVIEDQAIDGKRSLGRHLLGEGTFEVAAWPGAPLTVRVQSLDCRNWCARYADKDGNLRFRMEELGIQLPASGEIKILVEFGAVCSEVVRFSDSPYIADWGGEWQPDGGLWIYGQIKGLGVNSSVYVVVFGLLPWKEQIWGVESRASPSGEFEASLRANKEFGRWIAFLPTIGVSASSPEPAWLVKTLSGAPHIQPISGSDLRGDWSQWAHWASSLVKVPHPPDLNQLIQLLPLGCLSSPDKPLLRSHWKQVTPILVEQFHSLIAAGCVPEIVLSIEEVNCEGEKPIVLGRAEAQNPEAVLRAFSQKESTLVSLNWDGGPAIRATVSPFREEKLRISFEDDVVLCLDCLRRHDPRHFDSCRRFRVIISGSICNSTALVFWSPWEVLSGLLLLMKRADAEDGEAVITEVVRPWADRLREIWNSLPDKTSPSEWLDQVGEVARRWLELELNQSRQYTLQALQELAAAIRSHDGALLFVNWVREWTR